MVCDRDRLAPVPIADRVAPVSFEGLGLGEPIVQSLVELGYVAPTEVQRAVIPEVLAGRDVWASASTGSGKTAAFALPLLEHLSRSRGRARGAITRLILAPTRELAAQIAESIERYGWLLPEPPKCVVAVGGLSINPQMMALRGGADFLVATPGRLLDLMRKNAAPLGGLEVLVLDEADRLLDDGFQAELDAILAAAPDRPQTLLFSATFGPAIEAVAASVLREPVRIDVGGVQEEIPDIHHRAVAVDVPRRTALLAQLVTESAWDRVLVFVATSHATEHVAQKLRGRRIHAGALSGDLSQGARTEVLDRFRKGKLRVLVATDLAARGLDIAHLPAVVQYDLPRSTADYVHRAGRTGRAGRRGEAICFVTAAARAHFELIVKRHRVPMTLETLAGFEPTEEAPAPPVGDANGGIKGKRKSKKDRLREAAARGDKSPSG